MARREKSTSWSDLIQNEKSNVRAELAAFRSEKEQISFALKRARELYSGHDAKSYLRQFVYLMYALMSLSRVRCLPTKEVGRIAELAKGILTALGIQPGKSKLDYLWRDLHAVLSQIYRNDGRFWAAAIEHQRIRSLMPERDDSPEKCFYNLTAGILAMRVGLTGVALHRFEQAAQIQDDPSLAFRARLESIRALRLSGAFREAERRISALRRESGLPVSMRRELDWEDLCREVSGSREVGPLFTSVRRGRNHHESSYILEAFLWTRVVEDKGWLMRFPGIGARNRVRRLGLAADRAHFRSVKAVESLYDRQISGQRKLDTIYSIVESARKARTIDKEILLMAAVCRWLARNKMYELAALFLSEYRTLSMKLSDSLSGDVLGVMGDLLATDWFKRYRVEPQGSNSEKRAA